MTFQDNWNWQINYLDDVRNILKNQAMNIVDVEIATPEEDLKQCTDMKVKITAGDVAVRIRRENCKYRDITIRAVNKGNRTEIHKLREGYGDWYLYAWTDGQNIVDWILLDINKFRKSGLLNDGRKITMNPDGVTGFTAYSINELTQHNVVAAVSEYLV